MATNEAIAHFNSRNNYIVEYLYCYLKRYNFDLLGNTSSIATAVNSKTIKAMKFIKPNDNELIEFHNKCKGHFPIAVSSRTLQENPVKHKI